MWYLRGTKSKYQEESHLRDLVDHLTISHHDTGYPTERAGYPTERAGYPTERAGYPTERAGYPTERAGQLDT